MHWTTVLLRISIFGYLGAFLGPSHVSPGTDALNKNISIHEYYTVEPEKNKADLDK